LAVWLSSTLNSINFVVERNNFPKEGFMGLDLPSELAKEIWGKLRRHGARSIVIPLEYRAPSKLTLENASALAQKYYENELLPKEPLGLSAPIYVMEDVFWYTFRVASKHLAEIGTTPASYFINVDKLDGHVCRSVKEIMQITLDTWFY
jgi:hypothetical protein